MSAAVVDPEVLADPYPFYARLRDEAPVWKVPGVGLAYVSTHEHVVDACRRIDDFSSHLTAMVITGEGGRPDLFRTDSMGEGVTTLATADPPEHTIHRQTVFPELVARRMATMQTAIDGFVREQMDAARTRAGAGQTSRIEWTHAVANPVPSRTIGYVLGLPDENWPQVMHWALHGSSLLAGVNSRDDMAVLAEGMGGAGMDLAGRLITASKDPGDDLLGTLARAVADGALEFADAVGSAVILLGAGGESTASLIGNVVRLLAENPELQAELRDDPSRRAPFIEETLRLESPFKGHFREVKRDCELGGVELAAGTTTYLLWAAANRDSAEYELPDEIDLDRRIPQSHLAFGRGIHHCVGAPLARAETATALDALLDDSTSFSLPDDDPPSWVSSLFVRRHARLPLDVTWR